MDVSENSGTPKSSILIGFSIINHPFWGTTIFGNTYMVILKDFPFNSALVWVGKKKWPLFAIGNCSQVYREVGSCRCHPWGTGILMEGKRQQGSKCVPPPWLFRVYVGDDKLPSYMGIVTKNYWLVVSNMFFYFYPEMIPFDSYFSSGLVQPPTRKCVGPLWVLGEAMNGSPGMMICSDPKWVAVQNCQNPQNHRGRCTVVTPNCLFDAAGLRLKESERKYDELINSLIRNPTF